MNSLRRLKHINNYVIKKFGGLITIKRWVVYDDKGNYKGTFLKFKDAKTACLKNDFRNALPPLF